MSLILRGIKGSALTHAELDNNLVWLKSRDIVDASFNGSNLILTKDDTSFYSVPIGGGSSGNMWFIPSGTTVTVPSNYQSFIYGDLYVEGTLDLQSNSQLVVLNGDLYLTGGTVTGTGTVYVVESDNYVTGGTYSNGTLTLDRQNGSINISGFLTGGTSSSGTSVTGFTYNNKNQFSISQSDGTTLNATINIVTGLTSTGDISVNNLTVGKGGGNITSNTVFGLSSFGKNTNGNYNTSIGYQSLYSNTTGYANTALGYRALYNNTTVVTSLFINSPGSGYGDGTYTNITLSRVSGGTFINYPKVTIIVSGGTVISLVLTDGGNGWSGVPVTLTYTGMGTGIGFDVIVDYSSINEGHGNTAIGQETLFSNTTGEQNIAIGSNALNTNNAGSNNIAIGSLSLWINTTGGGNIGIGTNSLFNLDGGDYNTTIGIGAGSSITTGERNINIGANSSSWDTGNDNIMIGYGSTSSLTTTGSTVIGTYGEASDNNQFVVGSPLVPSGTITVESLTPTVSWTVKINGVDYKIPLQIA